MKIIIDKNIPYIASVFENFCDVGYFAANEIDIDIVCDADALIIRTRTRCDRSLLEGSKVKMIATATIGFDHIDLDYCAHKGIKVVNCAGCNANAVMQWVFAAIDKLDCVGVLGIVGVGNVGKAVEIEAKKRGMKTLLCDPPRALKEGSAGFVELDELLSKSDVVTMHVPLDKSTYGMCDEGFFRQLSGGIFLNASRGEVVNEDALKGAIRGGKVKQCALDVWCKEPNIDRELVSLVDIATPHIAGYSKRGKANATKMVVNQVASFFEFEQLKKWSPNVDAKFENPLEYDIMVDDAALRGSLNFEELRTNYKYR